MLKRDAERLRRAVRWAEGQYAPDRGPSRARERSGGGGVVLIQAEVKEVVGASSFTATMPDGTEITVYAQVYSDRIDSLPAINDPYVVPPLLEGLPVLVAQAIVLDKTTTPHSILTRWQLVSPHLEDTCPWGT